MLPEDPIMLYSFLNMKLRDRYANLFDLCEDLDVDEATLLNTMSDAGFTYAPEQNQFVSR